jgi:aminopeptidase N
MRRPLVATAVALALAVPLLGTTPALAAPGSTTGGDPYFPQAGNGGYDVAHYRLGLNYEPSTGRLDGTAVITFTATTDLASLSLDLRGLTATRVVVDARKATFEQLPPPPDGRGGELVVHPQRGLRAGSTHVVTVVYGGVPGRPQDVEGLPYGFVGFPDGALVANEPEGASTWYPVNDVPTDKATYDVVISVPQGLTAVANGELVGRPRTAHGRTVFAWRATDPMASYLSTASIGNYDLTTQTGPHRLPIYNYLDQDLTAEQRATAEAALTRQPEMIAFFERIYGRYPFTSFGAIVDDDEVGYALETQTRPVYSQVADEATVAHELAHQWVGDSVTPETWRDIWLNEGLATYSEWLWIESTGGPTVGERYAQVYAISAEDPFWTVPPGDPSAQHLFAAATYNRGAGALQALRVQIGDPAFFTLLRRWTTQHAGGNVRTADFVALAERVSHQQLDAFFQTWIYTAGKPAS